MNEPLHLLSLTAGELMSAARERLPTGSGVAYEVYKQAHRHAVFDPSAHGLSERAVEAWRAQFALTLPEVARVVEEDPSGTAKAVLRLHDGLEVECVRIPMGEGKETLCVSSQVGCKMGCTFCETGRMGLIRNLAAHEIVAQVVVARAVLGWDIKNLVFMGMGEALDNTDAVIQALHVLTDTRGLAFGQQRITVCTVGHKEGIEALAKLGWKRMTLGVSLNAPTDAKRSALMPVNRKTPLAALQKALLDYAPRDRFAFAVNYCLIPGTNDTREDASGVAEFCRPLGRVMLNLIPYNPGSFPIARAPSEEEIDRFICWLEEEHVPVRRRVTRGRSVMAACGQLGNLELRRRPRP